MKKAFRGLSVILALTLAAGIPGCSRNSPSSSTESASEKKVEQIDVFSGGTNTGGIVDDWWGKAVKDEIGVTFNLLPCGAGQAEQKLQAFMASGQLPDIIYFSDIKDIQNAIRGNMIVNLDDHMDKLPDVKKNVPKALQYSRDNLSNGTGKAYTVTNAVGPADIYDEVSWGPYLRWDLYQKIGSPAVNTVDDYLTILKKMQELEPKNKDGKKTYGISLFKDWDGNSMMMGTELGPIFGVDCGDQLAGAPFLQVDFTNGQTKNILDADSWYIKALQFYYKANQMGLLDPDSLTQTYATVSDKVKEGRVLFSWWPWFSSPYNTSDHTNADNPSGFAAVLPKNAKGEIPGDNNVGKKIGIAISSSTKKLDACLKFVNHVYSVEGMELAYNGPKGVVWDTDDSGKQAVTAQGWEYINDPNKELPGGHSLSGTGPFGSFGLSSAFINPETKEPISYHFWETTSEYNKAHQNKIQKSWSDTTGYLTTLDYVKAKKLYVEIPLAQSLLPTQPDDVSLAASRVGEIVKTDSWKMVFAKNDAEFQSYYNDMKTKAEGLGMKTVYDWSLKAWKSALASASKYQ